MPVLSDLFEPTNLDLEYPELLQKCKNVKINVSGEEVKIVEQDREMKQRALDFSGIKQVELAPQLVVQSTTVMLHNLPSH